MENMLLSTLNMPSAQIDGTTLSQEITQQREESAKTGSKRANQSNDANAAATDHVQSVHRQKADVQSAKNAKIDSASEDGVVRGLRQTGKLMHDLADVCNKNNADLSAEQRIMLDNVETAILCGDVKQLERLYRGLSKEQREALVYRANKDLKPFCYEINGRSETLMIKAGSSVVCVFTDGREPEVGTYYAAQHGFQDMVIYSDNANTSAENLLHQMFIRACESRERHARHAH